MQDMKTQAKIDVLKELMQMAKEAMRDKTKSGMDEMRSAQKVTVAAPDKESLLMGLEKAEDVLEGEMPEMEDSSEEKPSLEKFMEQKMEEDGPMMTKESETEEESKPMYMEDEEDDSMFAPRKPKKKMMDEE